MMTVMENKSPRRSGQVLLVWGLLVAAANLRASLTGVGPLLDRVQADLGLAPAVLGLLNTLPLLAFAALSPMVPRLAARWGGERLLGGALVVLTLGIAVRWVPSTVGLFAGTVLIGAGIAVGNVLLPSLIKGDFPTKVGRARCRRWRSRSATSLPPLDRWSSGCCTPSVPAGRRRWC